MIYLASGVLRARIRLSVTSMLVSRLDYESGDQASDIRTKDHQDA
jgi:hypothetical protein